MYGLVWGKAQQLSFADDHEYYRALGSLCRSGAYTITFETNSDTDSWSDAFRIKSLLDDRRTPDAFINAMRTARRINCNDYVQNLYEYHNFDFDVRNKVLIGDYEKVKKTVPSGYYYDFDEGYNLRFTRYGNKKTSPGRRSPFEGKVQHRNSQKPSQITHQMMNNDSITQKKPLPAMIKVNIGDKVRHKAYGEGKIYAIDGKYIRIHFEDVGNKTFLNPDAFSKGFLKLD